MAYHDRLTVIPWYDKADYADVLSLSGRAQPPGGYDAWMRDAAAAARLARRGGGAVQFVTVRPRDYRRWLGDHSLSNTASNRVGYLKDLVAQQRIMA